VRNSGVTAIVEGVGDHGCEYMTGGCVVVLGQIGSNFAAGMSGGIAYVLDEIGDFEKRCNTAMVDIERITPDQDADGPNDINDILADPLGSDEARLRFLIERHATFTQSQRARKILNSWNTYLPQFVKVMPVDYRRALLDAQEAAQQDHISLAGE
jgi:glutamate synthase (NADPH/NADH) large chain